MSSNKSIEGRVQAICLQMGPIELTPARYCDWQTPGEMWVLPGQRQVKQGGYGMYAPVLITEEEAKRLARRNGWDFNKVQRPRWPGVITKR
mgnify:CR=1 FL=1